MVIGEPALVRAYAGKRVLVTGHTGFKGAWLTSWLKRLGAEVTGVSDAVPTQPNHYELLDADIGEERADISDAEAVFDVVQRTKPQIVFHLAAQSLVRRAYQDVIATYRTNVLGTLVLFEACRKVGSVRAIVSATTDKVYRNREWEWGYRENDELGGSDPYSASKSCVELLTRSYQESMLSESDMLISSVRAGNVIGGGDWATDRLVPELVRAAFQGTTLQIRNPSSTRPWQHVLDPLAGYLAVGARLLEGDRDAAQAWNFGPAAKASIRVRDIVSVIQGLLPSLSFEIVEDRQNPHESGLLQLDSSSAMARLGWHPRWENQMLERTIEWYKAYYEQGRLLTAAQLDAYAYEAREPA